MNKLREKIKEAFPYSSNKDFLQQCEQITDDFSVKFADWFIDNYHDTSKTTTELLQIFKTQYYGKE